MADAELVEVQPGEELPLASASEAEPIGSALYDRERVLELGDRILIEYDEDKRVWGQVYYRSNTLLRLRPDMPGNTLIDFPREYSVDDRIDKFQDDLRVTRSFILKKRREDRPDFVRQQDFQVGQTLIGILKEGGGQGPLYTIQKINEEEDWITIVNNETQEEEKLNFGFCGIPLEQEIQILRIVKPEAIKEEKADAEASEKVAALEDEEGIEGTADSEAFEGEEEDIEDEGFVILPQEQVIAEADAASKYIPENLQKADAINDFLNMLPVADRKNPKLQRATRLHVELLHHMKRQIMDFRADGTFKGVKSPSVSTLLELIEQADVPMGRAVLDIEKRLFQAMNEKDILPESKDNMYFLDDDILTGSKETAFASSFVDTRGEGASQINYYMEEQINYEKTRTFKRGAGSGPEFPIRKDMLIFRSIIPDITNRTLEGLLAVPLRERYSAPAEFLAPPLGFLSYGLEMALTTTYRKGAKSQKVILFPEESAPLKSYLLFPQRMEAFLGTKRSGSLALDMMRGKEAMIWMAFILTALGPIQDVNTPDHIVPLTVTGSSLSAKIPITDYLEGLTLIGMGLGDLMIDLGNYGITEFELNIPIYDMLQKKIGIYQGNLITALSALRESIPKIPAPTPNPMLPIDSTPILDEFIRTQPILVESLEEFEAQNPTLRLSDVARVVHFLRYYSDFWQVTIGRVPVLEQEERLKTIKTIHLDRIANDQSVLNNKENRGLPPEPNTCEHVEKLATIRKLKEEPERMLALTKFLAHYQGGTPREDNWIPCNLCKKNLMCVHERLLIMAFLTPLEKEIIFKKIHLHFSGGIFQGHYICRSCGQPIQEIGLDTSIQFDKQGRPITGTSALKKQEVLTIEDLEKIQGISLSVTEELEFESEEQTKCYRVFRELAERIGIYMDRKAYETLIDNLNSFMGLLPSRRKFTKMEEKLKAADSTHKIRDYDTMIARIQICSAAIFLLYEIQSHIPEYEAKDPLPGCDAGFGGYPLETNEENRQGLIYMACAIASIRKEEPPWDQALFFKFPKGGKEEQIKDILVFMAPILNDIKKTNAFLERLLEEKRIWKTTALGNKVIAERLKDIVPSYFLPELVLPTVAEAAAEPVVALDARGLAKAWIRNAHALSRTNSAPVRGSPALDITCCTIPISSPGSFWNSQESLAALPLAGRVLTPLQRAPAQQFQFESRKKEALVVEMPKGLTYRLFTRVCYKGDRIGQSHEPGFTNRCHSCGFQFPVHPTIMDSDEAQTAVSKQIPDTSVETFDTLLETVRSQHSVDPYSAGKAEKWKSALKELRRLEYPPVQGWDRSVQNMLSRLDTLQKGIKSGDSIPDGTIAETLAQTEEGEVSLPQIATDARDAVIAAFGTLKMDARVREMRLLTLKTIAELPWHNFIQTLETYFLRIGKNLLYEIRTAPYEKYKNPKLASITITNIRESFVQNNRIYRTFYDKFSKHPFARQKMAKFLAQLTGIIRLKNRLRPSYFVGGKMTFKYIQMCLFYGPLAELFDGTQQPFEDLEAVPEYVLPKELDEEGEPISALTSMNDSSIKLLQAIINDMVTMFQQYQLSYNDDQLKQILEERAEKEKQVMLSSLQKMSAEEKHIHKQQRNLKIGIFGLDVIKKVVRYDKEQVEIDTNVLKETGLALSVSGVQYDAMDEPEGVEEEEGAALVPLSAEEVEAQRVADQGYGDNEDFGEFADETSDPEI
jgi:hypothetical protein